MKIGFAKELSVEVLEKAKSKGINSIVFSRIQTVLTQKMLSQFTLYDSSKLTTEAKEYAFKRIENRIEKLAKENAQLFYYKDYDLKVALVKELYWSLILESLNEKKCAELFQKGISFVNLDPNTNNFQQYLKFFIRILNPIRRFTILDLTSELENKIAIRINSENVLPIFGYLLDTLGAPNFICFQSEVSGNNIYTADALKKLGYKNVIFKYQWRLRGNGNLTFLKLIGSEEVSFLNLVIQTQNKLKENIEQYEALAKQGLKGFLLNAGENEGEGIISGLVAAKYNCKAFNFMNGTKFKDPIHQYTTFNYWFMHDIGMQEMLLSFSNKQSENLPIVGHLLEDKAYEHKYNGTLDKWIPSMENKKIIALFSSIAYNTERSDVVTFLHKFLDRNPNIIVLVRQHPSEMQEVSFSHEQIIVLPDFKEKSSLALFDLLIKADVAISFASTVSMQASWFGIPSASFEYNEKSVLYYVDQKKIQHIQTIAMLENFIVEALSKPKKMHVTDLQHKSVAQKMSDYLLQ